MLTRLALALVGLVILAAPVKAELIAEISGGLVKPMDQTIRFSFHGAGPSGSTVTRYPDGKFAGNYVVGGRVGGIVWEEPIHLGGVLDVSWMEINIGRTDLTLLPLSLLGVIRLPITPTYPDLSAYAAGGVSMVIGVLEYPSSTTPGVIFERPDPDVAPGIDARLGLRFGGIGPFAISVEYRFLYVQLTFKSDDLVDGARFRTDSEIESYTHFLCLVIGI